MARLSYTPRRRRNLPNFVVPATVVGILGLAGLLLWQPWNRGATPVPGVANPPAPELASKPNPEPAPRVASRDQVLKPQTGRSANDNNPPTASPPASGNPPMNEAGKQRLATAAPETVSRPSPTLLEAETAPVKLAGDTEPTPPVRSATSQPSLSPPREPTPVAPSGSTGAGARSAIDASRRKLAARDLAGARQELTAALSRNPAGADERELRGEMAKLADQTLFSTERSDANDPLVTVYKIQDTDLLTNIGKKFKVPYEIIMEMNGIKDARRIRAGQTLRVPNGPFHARISKSKFRMDLYLQDTYIRSYPVGLGKDSGTPEGGWEVESRLPNPTYFPPASAEKKKIIAPSDPANPLGEFWIGLRGISGEAKGQEGFGVHGTIEPDSIGKAASLGCVRMRNEDVAVVFKLLAPKHSTVTILP